MDKLPVAPDSAQIVASIGLDAHSHADFGSGRYQGARIGIPFEGVTNQHTFFVADALGATGLVEGRVNVRMAPDDILLSFPMGEPGHARIIGIVRDGDLTAEGELPE